MSAPERFRLFVAARVPEDRLAQLAELVTPLREKLTNARWMIPENQHLTLKFLGSTPADHLDAVAQTCTMVGAGHRPSSMAITELGAFPSKTRVRVLWMGVSDPDGLLSRLAADLDRALEPLGFASESRAYTPHLTLARFKLPVPLKSGFPSLDASRIEPFDIRDIVLFRSFLSPKGSRYEVMRSFPLGSKR